MAKKDYAFKPLKTDREKQDYRDRVVSTAPALAITPYSEQEINNHRTLSRKTGAALADNGFDHDAAHAHIDKNYSHRNHLEVKAGLDRNADMKEGYKDRVAELKKSGNWGSRFN